MQRLGVKAGTAQPGLARKNGTGLTARGLNKKQLGGMSIFVY